jgi:hypothetical protein
VLAEAHLEGIGVEAHGPLGQVLALPGLDGGPQGVPASGERRQRERDPEEDQAREGAAIERARRRAGRCP